MIRVDRSNTQLVSFTFRSPNKDIFPAALLRLPPAPPRNGSSPPGKMIMDTRPKCYLAPFVEDVHKIDFELVGATFRQRGQEWIASFLLGQQIATDAFQPFVDLRSDLDQALVELAGAHAWRTQIFKNVYMANGQPVPNQQSISVSCVNPSRTNSSMSGADHADCHLHLVNGVLRAVTNQVVV